MIGAGIAQLFAGTPDTSVYRPWLEDLRQVDAYGGGIDAVLRGLPRPGEPRGPG